MSSLRFVPTSIAHTPIDWTGVPEESKKYLGRWIYDWESLPATVTDFAKIVVDTKFCGYFNTNLCTLLMDISEFGLSALPDQDKHVGPRFYMEYDGQVWFLLFTPGKRDCVLGNSDYMDREDEEAFYGKEDELEALYERRKAEEVILAQEFDVILEQDLLRGMVPSVNSTGKLGGWEAHTLQKLHSPWRNVLYLIS